ncbi:ATP-binding protein [Streptomyces sp. 549]|uniref:ATP-binding protein n=1 Tax=Streptomyces sp. 549 TaxID=3049076 RepID=UPI0024C43D83|nr:ATP-binding protein [Streptomyces sp. 549]MDK1476234.1 ATP-binding protein [Streptomyces sp. 549]
MLSFPPDPVWVRTCRETVRASVLAHKRPELTDLAVLLTSEAAGNAITACVTAGCGRAVTLRGEWPSADRLEVHVHDEAPGLPVGRRPDMDAERGRGLLLIARLATRHGVCREASGPGKSLWFQVGGSR